MPGFLVHGPPVKLCMGLACVLSVWNTVSAVKGEAKEEKVMTFLPTTVSDLRGAERKEKGVAFLDTTELPARSVDLSELNLTELVNGMLGRALKGSKQFLSLLSITSYSSFAFHKFSVAVYNISNLKTVDPTKFPTRYCYCLSNRTNGLSDFTALLVDVIGNSTSYLTEIFKSTSILSVSQMNASDCIFICVMTGKSGRNLSDFWEMAEKSPVINYTFTSSLSGVLATRDMPATSELWPTSQEAPPGTSPPRPAQTTSTSAPTASPGTEPAQVVNTDRRPEFLTGTAATPGSDTPTFPAWATRKVAGTPWVTANGQAWAPTPPVHGAQTVREKTPAGPPWEMLSSTRTSAAEAEEAVTTRGPARPPARTVATRGSPSQTSPATGCPQWLLKEGAMPAAPLTLAFQKLSPCLMELCRFFQQCLCPSQRRDPRMEATRSCLEYYSWFLKNATYICWKAKRVSHSHTLKQRCLENICKSV
ncbi:HERV-H LTR-associating protein 1 [Pteropus vampyrus]|uniref:HERV-H LTR-associating protein 1 n=1 Tax=Pteropus vampyrus TaxID=132908 RepID=A0A6P6BK52_PTEVA|nr:HERV-H LTR-associating protein 1 [Pteropus vampyrus]